MRVLTTKISPSTSYVESTYMSEYGMYFYQKGKYLKYLSR